MSPTYIYSSHPLPLFPTPPAKRLGWTSHNYRKVSRETKEKPRGKKMECREAKDESENGGEGREETAEKSKGRKNIRGQSFRPWCRDKGGEEKKRNEKRNKNEERKRAKNNTRRERTRFCCLCEIHIRRFERMETRGWKEKRGLLAGCDNYGCIPFVSFLPASRSRHWSRFLNDLFSLVTRDWRLDISRKTPECCVG